MAVKFAIFSTDFGASLNPWAESELMPNQVDRDFSGASAWANVDLASYDESGDLSITAGALGQYCTCPVESAPTTSAKGYRLTCDVSGLVGTWTVKSFDGTKTYGTISAAGAQEIQWTATTTGGVRLVANQADSSGSFDNFSLAQIPITFIDLDEDPLWGFDPNAGPKGRGSRIQTLGGAVDQDFGVNVKDQVLKISVQDAKIAASVIAALEAAFGTVDGEYYMTNTVNCWKVRFARPGGFISAQNLFIKSALSEDVYSYEITLNVVSKDI